MPNGKNDTLPRMARYLDYFQALTEVGKALTSNLQHQEVLDAIMRALSQLMKPRNWSLMLLDPATNELYFEIVVGEAADKIKHLRVKVGEGIAGWVAEHKRSVVVKDVASDPRFAKRFDIEAGFNTQSIVCVPLVCRGQTLGVIELIKQIDDPEPYNDDDLHVLNPFADFAAIAIENARTFRRVEMLTMVDEWTQLYNARFLEGCLKDEVLRAKRYKHPLSLVFFDLDRFKTVNDTWGHSTGSALLATVGKILRESVRETDRPIRYGGDEFVIVMPETDQAGAMVIANRIREAIAASPPPKADTGFQLTASFGVATYPHDGEDARTLLDAADRAMYVGKARGRNVVVVANEVKP
jgi:diguanylate cyclase (GGDEF)-like protein